MSNYVPCPVKLPRAETPESVGVNSKVVLDYVHETEKRGFRFDSLMVFRNGKVACEFYWKPYHPDYPHDMYSFSKTVTATAVGFAIDEGLLSLDTKVYSFFPEHYARLKGKAKEYADQLTVHSLLTMRSGKKINMFNNTEKMDWTDNFLNAPFKCAPNKKWDYVSENIYMLSKLVTTVSGQTLVDFLTPRLFEPLEMGIPTWEGDHDGVAAGGWGLQLSAEQMAKFTLLYLRGGKWGDKQILPQSWLDVCLKKHIDTVPCLIHDGTGYGYQTWLNDNPHCVRFDGLYGQISVYFPEYDAFVMFNANDTREFEYIRMIFDYFPRAFADNLPAPDAGRTAAFNNELVRKSYDYRDPTPRNKKMEKLLSGKKIVINRKRQHSSALGVMTFFTWSKKPGYLEYVKFDFSGETPKFIWKEKCSSETCADICFDGEFAYTQVVLAGIPITLAIQGNWLGDKLRLNIHPIGRTQNRVMLFTFKGRDVKIYSKANLHLGNLLIFYMNFSGIKTPGVVKTAVEGAIKIANEVWMDPNVSGKIS